MVFDSFGCEQTEQIAAGIAAELKGGEILLLDGELGAGKTAFVRGLAAGLGITDRVVSPTFTIVNEYLHGKLPLFHFDVYRLSCADEMYDIGWEDYLARGGVIVAEWAVNVKELFENEDCIRIKIEKNSALENYRKITVEGNKSV